MILLGYLCLGIAFYFYSSDPVSMAGRFFNGMALGFFINQFYQKYKRSKNVK